MEITTMISVVALLGGGVTVWVTLNQRVTKLESVNDSQEKRIDQLEKRTTEDLSELRKQINAGFDSLRNEMKEDRKALQEFIINQLNK